MESWLGWLAVRWLPPLLSVPKPLLRGAGPAESSHFIPGARDGQTDSQPRCRRAALGKEVESRASSGPPACEMLVARAGVAELEVHGRELGERDPFPLLQSRVPTLCGRSCLQPVGSRGNAAGDLTRQGIRNSL